MSLAIKFLLGISIAMSAGSSAFADGAQTLVRKSLQHFQKRPVTARRLTARVIIPV